MKMKASEYLENEFGRLTFGRALKAHRMGNDLSQSELAEKIGVSKQAISGFERGLDFPSVDTVKRIAKVFRMDPNAYAVLIVQDIAEKKGFTNLIVKAG